MDEVLRALAERYPVQHPERLQLYSLATPNGKKIGVALEELGLPYEAHRVDIMAGEQHHPAYLGLNPNGKIPTLVDPAGPEGQAVALMESGAILWYLAEKTGQLVPKSPGLRLETLQWLFFQVGGVGPMFGQFGHFHKFARGKTTDTYALDRYSAEARRLLQVLETRLEGRDYLVGSSYTVADIATFPWVTALDFYEGKAHLTYDDFPRVEAWVQRCLARPATQRGLEVCALHSS